MQKIPIFIDSEESIPIVRCMQVEFVLPRREPVHNPDVRYRQIASWTGPQDA
jgi:hypothetical protein